MTPKEKSDFRALIMPHNPCKEALTRFDEAEGDEVYHIIMNYAGWLFNRCISIPKLPDHITELKYNADLRGYAHALPQLTSIGGNADLQGYAHALPQLTSIGGNASLRGYDHALPQLASIGGTAYLRWYAHALPQLTSIGGYADLRGYDHAEELKSNCKISGVIYE